MTVPTQDNPIGLPSFYCTYEIPLLLDYLKYFLISHTIGPNDRPHPFPAPHFKTLPVSLTYFSKCPIFSTYNAMLQL